MVEMVLSHCADRERWEFQGPKSWNQQWDFEREREGKCVGERETAAVQQLLMEVAYFFLVVNIYWSDGFEMHLQSWNGIRGVGVQSPLRSGKHVSERERGGLLISDEFGHPPRYGAPTPYLYWARVTTLYSSSFSMITIKTLDFSFFALRNVGYTPKSYNDFTIFLNDCTILLKRKFNGRL